jgi:hypothetical protein
MELSDMKKQHRELAERIATAIFKAPYGCGPDEVIRIAFRGGTDQHETDMGGFCYGALVDCIAAELALGKEVAR